MAGETYHHHILPPELLKKKTVAMPTIMEDQDNDMLYKSMQMLRVDVRQFRIKARWCITSVSLGLTYHFPDLHHILENSVEMLRLKYNIVNLLQNKTI